MLTLSTGQVPQWSASGITHAGLHMANTGDRIIFGRIFGSNRLDYAHLKEADDHYDIDVWENLGVGGTKRKCVPRLCLPTKLKTTCA